MGDRADKTLLKNVRDKIQSIDTDDLRMNQQSLAAVSYTHPDVYKRQE